MEPIRRITWRVGIIKYARYLESKRIDGVIPLIEKIWDEVKHVKVNKKSVWLSKGGERKEQNIVG